MRVPFENNTEYVIERTMVVDGKNQQYKLDMNQFEHADNHNAISPIIAKFLASVGVGILVVVGVMLVLSKM